MEECLGVNRRKLLNSLRTCVVGTMFPSYSTFYGRPPNFHNGLINLFCILHHCAALAGMSDC